MRLPRQKKRKPVGQGQIHIQSGLCGVKHAIMVVTRRVLVTGFVDIPSVQSVTAVVCAVCSTDIKVASTESI